MGLGVRLLRGAGPVLGLLLLAAPAVLAQVLLRAQTFNTTPTVYCAFGDLSRYKAWCEGSPINVYVASNLSCSAFNTCIPLEGYGPMDCANATYCDRVRPGGVAAAPACLVVAAAGNDTAANATCDLSVSGPTTLALPPPAPSPAANSTAPPGGGGRKWALWKTMAIIWPILGFFLLLVILYFLVRFVLRKRAERTQLTPVTVLTDVKGQPSQSPGHPGGMQGLSYPQLAPDGKPILAFGSHYPPPTSLQLMVMAGHMGHLPPTAGDALIQAAASSREAYNGAPIRTAPPLVLPPQYGLPGPNMSTAPGGVGGPMPYSAASVMQQASPPGAAPSPGPDSGPLPSPGSGSPLPMSRPAVLTPPAAATLDNPVAANDAVNAHPYR